METQPNVSHTDIYHKLGVLEGKLDSLVGVESRIHDSIGGVDTRVSALEQWRWFVIGISAAVASAASFLISYLEVPHG